MTATQLDLTSIIARARTRDPYTSHLAARSVDTSADRYKGILHLLTGQPMSDEDLWHWYSTNRVTYGWPQQSPSGLRTRRRELVDAGHVRRSLIEGRTESGRVCQLWELT